MRKQKLIAGLLTAAMLAGLLPGALAAAPEQAKTTEQAKSELSVDLQKTAGNLNTDWQTSVRLGISAPINESAVAVEFVVDTTTSLFSTGDEVLLDAWAEEVYDSMLGKNVYVGLTIFGSEAKTLSPMAELTADSRFSMEPADMAWLAVHNGTNIQAGIEAGLADLATAPQNVTNRYMVLITDGGAYWWMDGDTAVNNTANGTSMGNSDAAELDKADDTFKLHTLAELQAAVDNNTLTSSVKDYTSTASEPLADILNNQIKGKEYTNFEKGVAFAAEAVDDVKAAGVKLITVGYDYYEEDASLDALTTLADQFITYAEQNSVYSVEPTSLEATANELDGIMAQIYGGAVNTVIPAGSVITDEIGQSTTGEVYNFDLVKDSDIKLYFQDEGALVARLDENNQAVFTHKDGSQSVFRYYPASDTNSTEYFTLTLGRDVSRSNRVDLTYTLELVNPDQSEGTHYVDTNVDAWVTLYDKTTGTFGDSYLFPVPTLEYTFHYGPSGPSGGGDDGDVTIDDGETPLGPSLNTSDHFAYIIGRDDGYVHPEANITRAEVATIFFRMLTDASRTQLWHTSNSYPDVEATDWYNNAISTLTYSGVLTGTPEGVFKPDNNITRAEFATIAVRFFGGDYEGEDLFPDIAGHWANKYINLAATLGLVNGKGDGTFDPDAPITRAEAMAIVNRTLGRCPSADHMLSDMITWPDNRNTNAWYYADVQEATNSHDFDIIVVDNQQVESWTTLLEVRDWAALEREWSESNSSSNPGDVLPDTSTDTAAGN